ncbi:MAG: hypothetical protein IPI02_20770 [Sterolibacteriaceae bacterium]|nr:hypothetical protein [Sterolibacteriaceae bacterium]
MIDKGVARPKCHAVAGRLDQLVRPRLWHWLLGLEAASEAKAYGRAAQRRSARQ